MQNDNGDSCGVRCLGQSKLRDSAQFFAARAPTSALRAATSPAIAVEDLNAVIEERSDEAIQRCGAVLDCFAEPVIGPATSGRTRWLAMTVTLEEPAAREADQPHTDRRGQRNDLEYRVALRPSGDEIDENESQRQDRSCGREPIQEPTEIRSPIVRPPTRFSIIHPGHRQRPNMEPTDTSAV
jgi:hypothetical protein